MSANGAENFTVKEVVVEIRDTVKDLAKKLDRIDREGSIGTRAELTDHEERIRKLEERPVVTRKEIHDIKSDITGILRWREGFLKASGAVASLKWRGISIVLGLLSLAAGIVGSVATLIWLNN